MSVSYKLWTKKLITTIHPDNEYLQKHGKRSGCEVELQVRAYHLLLLIEETRIYSQCQALLPLAVN